VSDGLSAAAAREVTASSQRLIDSIEPRTLANLRDRAIIAVMGYAWAPLSAVLAMRVRDYYVSGDCHWVRLVHRGTERRELVARRLQQYMDEYLAAAGIKEELDSPLFRLTFWGRNGGIRKQGVDKINIERLLRHHILRETESQVRAFFLIR
jgi:site-specific recombinase XerC